MIVFLVPVSPRLVGALAAAGAGTGALIAAVARDLLPESHVLQLVQASFWTMLGALVFSLGERYVHRKFGSEGASRRTLELGGSRLWHSPHERSSGAGIWTVVGFCASFAMV